MPLSLVALDHIYGPSPCPPSHLDSHLPSAEQLKMGQGDHMTQGQRGPQVTTGRVFTEAADRAGRTELQATSISPVSNRQAGRWRREEGDRGQALLRAPGPTDREQGRWGLLPERRQMEMAHSTEEQPGPKQDLCSPSSGSPRPRTSRSKGSGGIPLATHGSQLAHPKPWFPSLQRREKEFLPFQAVTGFQ